VRSFGVLASYTFVVCAIAAAVLTGGCTQSPPAAGPPLKTASNQQIPAAVTTERPTVEILSWDQTQKRLADFHGKVVVLDVWSTYCDPCVREFPNLVALQTRFGDKVRCISFDTDYSGAVREPAESFRKLVLEFLSKHGAAGLLNVISSDPAEDFYNKIRLGGPPAVFVYDASGKLVKRFDNSQVPKTPEFTYQRDIVPLVEKLLAGAR
jgi:thiol-disulfide isomerase/thioredoxin